MAHDILEIIPGIPPALAQGKVRMAQILDDVNAKSFDREEVAGN
jgi:hypothetical protein